MHIRPTVLLLFVFFSVIVKAQTSEVTLPLAEFERLRGAEPESFTVIDSARLAGTFRERNLTVTFAGKGVGRRVATAVLSASSGISVWGCDGQAVIRRGDDAFLLTPLADSFRTTCRIAAAGSDRIELVATRDVLAIESAVADGELVPGTKDANGTSRYSLVRQSSAPEQCARAVRQVMRSRRRRRAAI